MLDQRDKSAPLTEFRQKLGNKLQLIAYLYLKAAPWNINRTQPIMDKTYNMAELVSIVDIIPITHVVLYLEVYNLYDTRITFTICWTDINFFVWLYTTQHFELSKLTYLINIFIFKLKIIIDKLSVHHRHVSTISILYINLVIMHQFSSISL